MDLNDAAHVAKLARFGINVTAAIDREAEARPDIGRLVATIASDNAVSLPVSLLNQAAFLGQLYVSLLWAREAVRDDVTQQDAFADAVAKWFDHRDSSRVQVLTSGGRDLADINDFLRTVRNALAHARVDLWDEPSGQFGFEFSDGRGNDRAKYTTVRMPAQAVGQLADAATWAISFVAHGLPHPPP